MVVLKVSSVSFILPLNPRIGEMQAMQSLINLPGVEGGVCRLCLLWAFAEARSIVLLKNPDTHGGDKIPYFKADKDDTKLVCIFFHRKHQ